MSHCNSQHGSASETVNGLKHSHECYVAPADCLSQCFELTQYKHGIMPEAGWHMCRHRFLPADPCGSSRRGWGGPPRDAGKPAAKPRSESLLHLPLMSMHKMTSGTAQLLIRLGLQSCTAPPGVPCWDAPSLQCLRVALVWLQLLQALLRSGGMERQQEPDDSQERMRALQLQALLATLQVWLPPVPVPGKPQA